MNIAIIGYGRMGREIAAIAKERGHNIMLTIDVDNASDLNEKNLEAVDVAIEFSSPKSAFSNIITTLKSSTPVVSGTTGWLDKLDEAAKISKEYKTGLFYASNFSIGVNILFTINGKLAQIMNDFPEYKVSLAEVHHIHKLDAPSGTAISLSDQICKNIDSKKGWSMKNGTQSEIFIDAKREGEINGFHSVTYDSDVDTITISHNAKSRKGFATGAVLAAEYIIGKTGIHSMTEMLNL